MSEFMIEIVKSLKEILTGLYVTILFLFKKKKG